MSTPYAGNVCIWFHYAPRKFNIHTEDDSLEKDGISCFCFIYIYIIIYQVGGFFSSTQVDKTEANWIISSMAIRNIRNDLKSTRWPGHLSPFPIISALVPRYTPSSPWPWFQRGWLPGFAGVVAILSFYGEIQESDGKFKHPTKI